MDLLRLLALDAGRPLRVASLVDKLWPAAEHARGLASLRTAASEIRTTLHEPECLARRHDSLVLLGVEVDAVELVAAAEAAHRLNAERRYHESVAAGQRAARLYQDDFHAYDDLSPWARDEGARLVEAHAAALRDGAQSALQLGQYEQALDLANVVTRAHPLDERAHRVLMRCFAELGEMGRALQVFETNRVHLADELGADPSHQTRELHGWLLRQSDPPRGAHVPPPGGSRRGARR
jgi:DNA-binding SARP family transcriptional activator